MELSIQERLKDLRVERGLTLEQLAEQTHLSKSALGSYEGDNLADIKYAPFIELAKFEEVTVDYLLGRFNKKSPKRRSCRPAFEWWHDWTIKKAGHGQFSLCELATRPDFPGSWPTLKSAWTARQEKQVQSANAIVDAVSATIMKQHNPGLTDLHRQLIAAHIDTTALLPLWYSRT